MQHAATLTPEKLTAARSLRAALACLARGRDEQAWTDLLELAGADILRVTRGILGEHALAEDAAQETLLRIRDHAARFSVPDGTEPAAAARSWIMRIACTTALRILRSRRRTLKREQDYGEAQRGRSAQKAPAADDEKAELVRVQLEQLPAEQRVPLVLHFIGGLEYVELAAQIGCPAATARTRVHRGLKALRERLALCGLLIPVGGVGDLLQMGSSGGVRLDVGQMPGWRELLNSPRRPLHTEQVVYGAAAQGGGLSLMAKLGLTALALGAGAAAILTFSSARSAEEPAPGPASIAEKVPAPKPAAAPKDPNSRTAELKPVDTDADIRRRLANTTSLNIEDRPLSAVADLLSKAWDIRVAISADLKDAGSRKVTINETTVPVKVVLDNLVKSQDLAWTVQKSAVVIGPKPAEGAVRTTPKLKWRWPRR